MVDTLMVTIQKFSPHTALNAKKMIKAIIFDLWGVLATKKYRVFDAICQSFNLDESAHPHFVELLNKMEIGAMNEADFWAAFGYKLKRDFDNGTIQPWLVYYEAIMIINQPLLKFVKSLKNQGYKVAIVSNTDAAAVERLKILRVIDGFDVAIFSCEAGLLKPNEEIYRVALQSLHVRPEEAIFIDDQKKWVDAAEKLGIKGGHIQRHRRVT